MEKLLPEYEKISNKDIKEATNIPSEKSSKKP